MIYLKTLFNKKPEVGGQKWLICEAIWSHKQDGRASSQDETGQSLLSLGEIDWYKLILDQTSSIKLRVSEAAGRDALGKWIWYILVVVDMQTSVKHC